MPSVECHTQRWCHLCTYTYQYKAAKWNEWFWTRFTIPVIPGEAGATSVTLDYSDTCPPIPEFKQGWRQDQHFLTNCYSKVLTAWIDNLDTCSPISRFKPGWHQDPHFPIQGFKIAPIDHLDTCSPYPNVQTRVTSTPTLLNKHFVLL